MNLNRLFTSMMSNKNSYQSLAVTADDAGKLQVIFASPTIAVQENESVQGNTISKVVEILLNEKGYGIVIINDLGLVGDSKMFEMYLPEISRAILNGSFVEDDTTEDIEFEESFINAVRENARSLEEYKATPNSNEDGALLLKSLMCILTDLVSNTAGEHRETVLGLAHLLNTSEDFGESNLTVAYNNLAFIMDTLTSGLKATCDDSTDVSEIISELSKYLSGENSDNELIPYLDTLTVEELQLVASMTSHAIILHSGGGEVDESTLN